MFEDQQLMSKENLESQVVALQQTAAQHKAQRDVLDAKLVAAQDNLARLEEEASIFQLFSGSSINKIPKD